MVTITSSNDVQVGMPVRPKGGRYDWVVYEITDRGGVNYRRYSDSSGWVYGFKTANAIAKGELKTYAR